MPDRITITHDAGFFSNCSVLLEAVLEFARAYGQTPAQLDTSGQFLWYRAATDPPGTDVRAHFFVSDARSDAIACAGEPPYLVRTHALNYVQQFSNYDSIDYAAVAPFVHKYFSPVPKIEALSRALPEKYALDPKQTCAIFHRGNDKGTEVCLPDYEDYAALVRGELAENPDTQFLIQSDESEFLEVFGALIPGAVIFRDEIRHMPRCASTVDKVFADSNHAMVTNFLAITLVMSRCRTVVCGSGNCAMWVALYRGHSRGVRQIPARMLSEIPAWILGETRLRAETYADPSLARAVRPLG